MLQLSQNLPLPPSCGVRQRRGANGCDSTWALSHSTASSGPRKSATPKESQVLALSAMCVFENEVNVALICYVCKHACLL